MVRLLAPAGTPPEIVARIAREAQGAGTRPAQGGLLLAQGAIPSGMPPAEFAAFIPAETKKVGGRREGVGATD